MVFDLLLFGFLLFASPGHADFRMATGSGRIPIKMMEMSAAESPKAAPNNLRVGITIDRFSAVDMKRSTVNASDMNIYARHTHMSTHAQLGKRVDCDPTMSEQECRRPPLFPMPACFWCPKAAVLDDPFALLATFTTDEFKRRTRANPATDLRDTCVFYSRTVIAGGPSALSRVATQLACQYGKYSIWHLWPNRKNEQNNNRLLNFYGIFSPDNRLYSISKMGVIPGTSPPKDYFRVYFENMSEAMAQMCTGQIYLLTQTPQNLAQYGVPPLAPNIWSGKELPALRNHLQELESSLIVIDSEQYAAGNVVAYQVNWRTLNVQGNGFFPFRKRDVEYEPVLVPYNLTVDMGPWTQKRADLCDDSGVDDEPAGMDFFG